MYDYQNEVSFQHGNDYRQQPSVKYIPPTVIDQYVNQWITTSIPGYGQVIAYVLDYNQRTGMVSMFIYPAPRYQQQYIQVHHSDLVGISPYFGPTPPRPRPGGHPGHGNPGQWHGGGHPGHGNPGQWHGSGHPGHGNPGQWHGGGGGQGFWPWFMYGLGSAMGGGQREE